MNNRKSRKVGVEESGAETLPTTADVPRETALPEWAQRLLSPFIVPQSWLCDKAQMAPYLGSVTWLGGVVYATCLCVLLYLQTTPLADMHSEVYTPIVKTLHLITATVFGTGWILGTVTYIFSPAGSDTTSLFVMTATNFISFIAHSLTYGHLIPVFTSYWGRYIFPLKYAEWMVGVPVLMYILGDLLFVKANVTLWLAMSQFWMIAFGFIGSVTPEFWAWVCLIISCILFIPAPIVAYQLCLRMQSNSTNMDQALFQLLGVSIVSLWTLYPIMYFLGVFNVISKESEVVWFAILDVTAKTIFTAVLLQGCQAVFIARLAGMEIANTGQKAFQRKMLHSVQMPFNAMIQGLQELMQKPALQPYMEMLDTMEGAGLNARTTIENVLALSNLEDGKLGIANDAFNPKTMVVGVVTRFVKSAKADNVTVEMRVDPALPELVLGDEMRLAQILENLVSNAVRFSPEGSLVTVKVAVLQQSGSSAVMLRLAVQDRGVGFTPDAKAKLIGPFSPSVSTVLQGGGAGLGLCVVQQLTELMAGRVGLDTEPGHGSEFYVDVTLSMPAQQHQRKKSV